MRRLLLIPALLALGACGVAPQPRGEVGTELPAYAARTLDGDSVALADLRGEPVLLNVWATWCPPCRKEMPELQALHEELGPAGLRVVGVSIDAAGADPVVRNFLEEYGVTYTILRDPDERIGALLAAQGVPVTLLLDRDGTVLWRRLGPVHADDPTLREAIERAFASRGGA